MWIRFLESHPLSNGKKMPVGRVVNKTRDEAKPLIEQGIAEEYVEGVFPPRKVKTEFFKPKKSRKKWQPREQ